MKFVSRLTAKQLDTSMELDHDRQSIGSTLDRALSHHANALQAVNKRNDQLWMELMASYHLDPRKHYVIDRIGTGGEGPAIYEKEEGDV